MGREVKRVALDFNWPLRKTWIGYINPYRSQECPKCGGSGLNAATKKIEDTWYGPEKWVNNLDQDDVNVLVAANRLMDFTHVFDHGWKEKNPKYVPTAKEVNEWSLHGFGHDTINEWVCVEAKAKRLGVYGLCPLCNGEGEVFFSEEIKKLNEEWQSEEPPAGEGWQMWETTSEGSPISPVCKTPEELAHWLADNNASSFGDRGASYEEWFDMIEAGWAPSAIMHDGIIESGVAAIGKE